MREGITGVSLEMTGGRGQIGTEMIDTGVEIISLEYKPRHRRSSSSDSYRKREKKSYGRRRYSSGPFRLQFFC